jgi:hypothetical protein
MNFGNQHQSRATQSHPTELRPNWLRRHFRLTIAITILAAVLAVGFVTAAADDNSQDDAHGRDGYAIGRWGDLPYSTAQATIGVPNLIADMNSQVLPFHRARWRS